MKSATHLERLWDLAAEGCHTRGWRPLNRSTQYPELRQIRMGGENQAERRRDHHSEATRPRRHAGGRASSCSSGRKISGARRSSSRRSTDLIAQGYVLSNKVNVRTRRTSRARSSASTRACARSAGRDEPEPQARRRRERGATGAADCSVNSGHESAAALAVAGGGRDWRLLPRLLRAFRSGLALLVRAHAACSARSGFPAKTRSAAGCATCSSAMSREWCFSGASSPGSPP